MTNTEINTKASEFKIIEDKKDEPKYKEVSKFVGGMVECITFPNGDLLLINEEGKLINLPLNPEATALWRATFDKRQKVIFSFVLYLFFSVHNLQLFKFFTYIRG